MQLLLQGCRLRRSTTQDARTGAVALAGFQKLEEVSAVKKLLRYVTNEKDEYEYEYQSLKTRDKNYIVFHLSCIVARYRSLNERVYPRGFRLERRFFFFTKILIERVVVKFGYKVVRMKKEDKVIARNIILAQTASDGEKGQRTLRTSFLSRIQPIIKAILPRTATLKRLSKEYKRVKTLSFVSM